MNLAIGGWAGDDIEITADKPAYFEADWVRVWQAKPAKPDTVRIMSMNFGTCMVKTADDKLALGDCSGDNAIATMTPLSGSAYRINFGDVVVEIPNEKTDAGVSAGLYKWNGGSHQKIGVEKQSGYEGNVVRMKMQNSNLYLRATTDGERVVQSWADDWEWNQMWRLLKLDDEIPSKDKTPLLRGNLRQSAHVYGSRVYRKHGMLYVTFGDENGPTYDFKGRLIK